MSIGEGGLVGCSILAGCVCPHLGKRLIDRRHALNGLNDKSEAIEHKHHYASKNESNEQDHNGPNSYFNFLLRQKPIDLEFVGVGQLVSPE